MRKFVNGIIFGILIHLGFECSFEGHTSHALIFSLMALIVLGFTSFQKDE